MRNLKSADKKAVAEIQRTGFAESAKFVVHILVASADKDNPRSPE